MLNRAAAVILVLVCIAVRVVALDGDPPSWLSWSSGIATDEGFYTLDARHMALFGTWAPGNFHDRLLSPLLSELQEAVFRVAGAGLVQARAISVAFGLLTLIVFWSGLRRAVGLRAAWFGVLFLGLMPPVVLYNRMALQETPATFFLVLAFFLACYGWPQETGGTPVPPTRYRWAWLAGAGACAALAVTVKATAVIALPAFVTGAWAAGKAQRRVAMTAVCGGMAAVFAVYAVTWYLPNHAQLSRMGAYYASHQYRPHGLRSLWLNIRRGYVGDSGGVFRGLAPYLLATAAVPVLLAVRRACAVCRRSQVEAILATWLVCGVLFCLLASYAPSRYYVLFLSAPAGLAAISLTRLPRGRQAVAGALFLLTSGLWLVPAIRNGRSGLAHVERQVGMSLIGGSGSVVVGDFAPELCMDTQLKAAPVQPGLSNDKQPVERMHADYVAVTRAPVWQTWWRERYPEIVRPENRDQTVIIGANSEYTVDIYRVPLRRLGR